MAIQNTEKVLQFKFGADVKALNEALNESQNKIKELTKLLQEKKQRSSLELIELQAKAGIRPLRDLKLELEKVIKDAARVNKEKLFNDENIVRAVIRLKEVNRELRAMAPAVEEVERKSLKLGEALKAAVLPLTSISLALGGVTKVSTDAFRDFDKTLRTISAVAETSEAELERIRDASIVLGQETIFSNQEVADSFLELARAGFTVEESLEAMPALLELATAAGNDLGLATETITKGLRAFGLTTADTARFVDVLAQSANKSAADIGDMKTAFRQVAPTAVSTGQSLEQMAAALVLLSNASIEGGDAGSDLRNLLIRLSGSTKETRDALKTLGVSATDAQGNFKPFLEIVKELQPAFAKFSQGDQLRLQAALAGAENIKTLSTLLQILPEDLEAALQAMEDAEGAASRMAEKINSGINKALEELGGTLDTIKTQLGEAIAPIIEGLATAFTEFLNVLGSNKQLVEFTAGVVAAGGVIAALGTAVAGLVFLFEPLVVALGGMTAVLSSVVAPALSVIAAFGLLVVALNNVHAEIDTSAPIYKDLENNLNGLADAVQDLFGDIGNLADRFFDLIETLIEAADKLGLVQLAVVALDGVVLILQGAIRLLGLVFQGLSIIVIVVESNINQLGIAMTGLIEAFNEFKSGNYDGAFEAIANAARKAEVEAGRAQKKILETAGLLEKTNEQQRKQEQEAERKQATVSVGATSNLGGGADKAKQEASKIKRAQEQFQREVARLQAEMTEFEVGQFARRKLEADEHYNEQIKKLRELGKTGRFSAGEIAQAEQLAFDVFRRQLEKISREEANFFENRTLQIRAAQAMLAELDAELSSSDPLDDVQAKLNRILVTIDQSLAREVEELAKAFNFDINDEEFRKAVETAESVAERRRDIARRTSELEANDALRKQEELANDILILRRQLAGDELAIEKAKNQKIVDDLEFRLKAVRIEFGEESPQFNRANLELEAAKQEAAKKELQVEKQAVEARIQLIEEEIRVYGDKRRRQQEIQVELEKQVVVLTKMLSLLDKTSIEYQRIKQQLTEVTGELIDIKSQNSVLGRLGAAFQTFGQLAGNSIGSLFGEVGSQLTGFNKAFTAFKNDTSREGKKSLLGFLGQNEGLQAGFTFASGVVGAIGSTFAKSGVGQKITGALTGALSGAAAGATFGPIGAAIGGIAGLVGGIFGGGGPDKKAEKAQKNLEKTQRFIDSVLATTDTNDLESLNAALHRVLTFKSGGGEAFRAKRAAAQQLQQAIKQRQKVIAEAIEDLRFQNEQLTREMEFVPGDDFKNFTIERENQLAQVAREAEKAKEKFKDSAEAQALIEQNAALKRQLLYKEASEAIIRTVIEEQNQIRELRAQTAIDTAKASGNVLSLINAELQARLVAIENEIAAFEGAEEKKTEFLKAKVAEREAAIADSQQRVDDLLRAGLDIINEGLVISETKSESQQRRLKKLFGNSLNPFGTLTGSGSLLQTSVTISAGAFQFIMQGIEDAETLVDQLEDPVIQARLTEAINAAIARRGAA